MKFDNYGNVHSPLKVYKAKIWEVEKDKPIPQRNGLKQDKI